jgi:hypothetical protein
LVSTIKLCSYSQDFIDHNRFSVEAEVGTAFPILNGFFNTFSYSSNSVLRGDYEKSYFPPNLGLNVGYTLSEKLRVISRFSWKGLQNSELNYISKTYTYEDQGTTILKSYSDSFQLASDALSATLGFRVYLNEAPIGFYAEVNGGYSQVTSSVYPTFHTSQTTLYEDKDISIIEKGAPGIYKNGFIKTSFGFGGSIVFQNKMFLNLGARIAYYYGNYYIFKTFDLGEEKIATHRENLDSYVKLNQLTNLQSSFLFESHASIGIFF